jgi:hypothetical protein
MQKGLLREKIFLLEMGQFEWQRIQNFMLIFRPEEIFQKNVLEKVGPNNHFLEERIFFGEKKIFSVLFFPCTILPFFLTYEISIKFLDILISVLIYLEKKKSLLEGTLRNFLTCMNAWTIAILKITAP